MFDNLKNKSKTLTGKIKVKVEDMQNSKVIAETQALLGEHWSKIETMLIHSLLSVAKEKLHDEEFLETAFEKAYELLPTAVRLLVSRKRFLDFADSRSDVLRQKVIEKRTALNETNAVLGMPLEIKNHEHQN